MKKKIDKRQTIALHPGQHPAVISHETFLKNQQLRKARHRVPANTKRAARRYVLRDVGKCWECWASFQEVVGFRGSLGGRNKRPRYKCAAVHSRYASRRPKKSDSLLATLAQLELSVNGRQEVQAWQARHHTFMEAKALTDVEKFILSLELPPEWQRRVLAYLHHPDGILYFNRQLRDLRAAQKQLQRAYHHGEIDLARLQIEGAKIEARIAAFWRISLPNAERFLPYLNSFPNLWEQLTSAEQNDLLKLMFEALFFDNQGRLRWVLPHAPFDRLLNIPPGGLTVA